MEEHNCVACAIFDIRETDVQAHGWTDRLTKRSLSVAIPPRQHKNNTVEQSNGKNFVSTKQV